MLVCKGGGRIIQAISQAVWGPGTVALLLGTGIFLTLRTRFLALRNLGWALKAALGKDARSTGQPGDISPLSALLTMLATTIGTGNIVGVATALTAGGPGALVWMEISALFGLSSHFAESMLAVKYRRRNAQGEMCGGPMYVMAQAIRPRWLGRTMAAMFALFAVLASFGIGNMAQANSMSAALSTAFDVPTAVTGVAAALLILIITLGGIRTISRAAGVLVPCMAVFYLAAGILVILGHLENLPASLVQMLTLALSPRAAAGGFAGWLTAMQIGVSRGVFSNEAGMGSAAITAASAATDSPARQGYISMTGIFFDTTVICTVTGLAICCSGVLESAAVDGAALTILAFSTVLGRWGGVCVAASVALFAFSSILGWAYQGEKALEYLAGQRLIRPYRLLFALAVLLGAIGELQLVWSLSDIFNGLMALPNLVCLLLLSGTMTREMMNFQRNFS